MKIFVYWDAFCVCVLRGEESVQKKFRFSGGDGRVYIYCVYELV